MARDEGVKAGARGGVTDEATNEATDRPAASDQTGEWAAWRAADPVGGRFALLCLGDETVTVLAGEAQAAQPEPPIRFDTGVARLAARHFARGTPTALALEAAIETVEDAVMRPPAGIAGTSRLVGADPALRAIAVAAGHPPGVDAVLDLESIERVFDRLAARALGRPVSQDALPPDAAFAASLVIVRELMHHQRISEIHVRG
jgi:exopolyphosphatase/pppGpp-phosphohydrolase